ncbi:MAG: imidazole glycerol phosphate synthase subunit HisH [Pseudomonadota bacterium]
MSANARRDIVIIDGCGANLASLQFALQRLDQEAEVTKDAARIRDAELVLLPGVGAAGYAMAQLRESGLDAVVPTLRQPVLGICLGMQLLLEGSDEDNTQCLGVVPGRCERFEPSAEMPTPHMGWNRLRPVDNHPLFANVDDGAHCYFVHSFAASFSEQTAAWSDYGVRFAAAVSYKNFHGVQFHPERSGKTGAQILANFLTF